MPRTLFAACSTLAAISSLFLFAGSAAAENDPDITYPTGTLLSVSPEAPKLQGTALALSYITAGGLRLYQCTNFATTGSLEKNTGTHGSGLWNVHNR
jgi:hypothetical protein